MIDIPAFALCIVISVISLIVLAMHSLIAAAVVVLLLAAGIAVWSVWPEVDGPNGSDDCHP